MRLEGKGLDKARAVLLGIIQGPMAAQLGVTDGRSFGIGLATAMLACSARPGLAGRFMGLLDDPGDSDGAAAHMIEQAIRIGIEAAESGEMEMEGWSFVH